jgi:ferredoxin
MDSAWALRKAGEPLLHAIPGDRKPVGFIEDAAVPPENLASTSAASAAIVEREGTVASYYAHASVGVLHVRPLLDLSDESDRAAMERIAVASADLAKELGGVMSGEHGDGRARGPAPRALLRPRTDGRVPRVKAIFDPENRLNPGNIVEPGPIGSIHADTRGRRRATHAEARRDLLRFLRSGRARPRGEPVQRGGGVPQDERGGDVPVLPRHARRAPRDTRARQRAAARDHGAVDEESDRRSSRRGTTPRRSRRSTWCLSCKACKSECPSNVDVAKMKAEYTAQRHRASGRVPLRDRVFGNIHTLNRLAGLAPALANLGMSLTRPLANALLGLHPERSLPDSRSRCTGSGGPLPRRLVQRQKQARQRQPSCSTPTPSPPTTSPRSGSPRRVLNAFGYRVELFRGIRRRPRPDLRGAAPERDPSHRRRGPAPARPPDRSQAPIAPRCSSSSPRASAPSPTTG